MNLFLDDLPENSNASTIAIPYQPMARAQTCGKDLFFYQPIFAGVIHPIHDTAILFLDLLHVFPSK